MKYVLVDNNNQEVISTAELASNVGLSGAKTYFVGIKKIEEKEFNKLSTSFTDGSYDLAILINQKK